MFRCKDLKILVLVPSPAAAAQVTRCRLLHLSVHPVPGRQSTACSSTALWGLQNTEICPDWKVKTLPVFHCEQNLCAGTKPLSGPCVVKKCLTWFSHAQTEETCPSREGWHKAFLHGKPCSGTAPWERASERTVQEETGSMVGALRGSPMLQSAGALGRAGPWGWDYGAGALAYSESCLSILAVAWWREKYFRQKGKRNNQETVIVGSYIYVHPAGLPWRRHLQCLQGWPLSSAWFLIPHPTLSPGFSVVCTSSSDQSTPAQQKDGWSAVWSEVWDKTQANIIVCLCVEYASRFISHTWAGLICEPAKRETVGL